MRIFSGILLSCLFHAVCLSLFFGKPKKQEKKGDYIEIRLIKKSKPEPTVTKPQIVKKPKISEAIPESAEPSPKTIKKPEVKKKQEGDKQAQNTITNFQKLSYSDLVNKGSMLLSEYSEDKPLERYQGKDAHHVKRASMEMATSIDIPLVLRRSLKKGSSRVILEKKNQQIYIRKLWGEAHLRAALFESLKLAKNRSQIQIQFEKYSRKSFSIVLEYDTSQVTYSLEEFQSETVVYNDEVRIKITHHTQHGLSRSVGLVIEDEHSLLAKKRDARQLLKLRKSRAYLGPIENMLLFST